MYEYVKKSEYAPVRAELETIIKKVQIEMRKKHKLTFQFQLIGSGQGHLVTRIRGGNRGYDFDYNLILQHPGNERYKAAQIKRNFMEALDKAVKGTRYSFSEDSTSAITIKVVDKKNKKICYSCDFAVVYDGRCGERDGFYYLRHNKKQNRYEFVFRPLEPGIKEKVKKIRARDQGWNHIREEYLKLKNINKVKEKHSYFLYMEAVHNVYHRLFYQNFEE
ncbi:MAG: hypothetical protein HFI69_07650 [Lachnospiraceae bacterium]|nr:hypothetical protein [Lachnospiraceae bacterium]